MARRIDPAVNKTKNTDLQQGAVVYADPSMHYVGVPKDSVEHYQLMGYEPVPKREGGASWIGSIGVPEGAEQFRKGCLLMSISNERKKDIDENGYQIMGSWQGGQKMADEIANSMSKGMGRHDFLDGMEGNRTPDGRKLVHVMGYDPDTELPRKELVSYEGRG